MNIVFFGGDVETAQRDLISHLNSIHEKYGVEYLQGRLSLIFGSWAAGYGYDHQIKNGNHIFLKIQSI
jgi:hypothetical protein